MAESFRGKSDAAPGKDGQEGARFRGGEGKEGGSGVGGVGGWRGGGVGGGGREEVDRGREEGCTAGEAFL